MKQLIQGFFKQLGKHWKLLLIINIPVLLLSIVVIILVFGEKIPDTQLLYRDVVTLGELPFYAGFMSQISGLLWSGTTAICLFTYFITKSNKAELKRGR